MINLANYQFPDPLSETQRGFAVGNALRDNYATRQAGKALQSGDYGAAASQLYGAGMIGEGQQVQNYGQQQQDRVAQADSAQRDQLLKFTADAASRLADYHRSTGDLNKTLAVFDQMAPQFQQYGESPQEIADVRQRIASDPEGTLVALGAGAAKQAGYEIVKSSDGSYAAVDPKTGKPAYLYDASLNYYAPKDGSQPATPASSNQASNPDAVWQAVKQQESGGDGNAVGPVTPYGQAQGSTQMLMPTAEAMARKLGMAWNPSLMRGDTPRALAYQDKLGRAYFEEGLQKYGGDVSKALAYYHGGPDESLWGPKTQAYVQAVQSRLGGQGDAQPYEVASNGATPAPPGYQLVHQGRQPKNDGKWQVYTDPKTNTQFRYNAATHESTTLDGQPYTPSALSKLSGGGQPRSAAAAAVQRFIQLNPDATPEDISQFNARMRMQAAGATAFGSGKQGQTINSLNVSIDHLSTLQDLSNALHNGDVQALNRIGNRWAAETGNPAPSNFEAAKQIVADEIVKGIVGAGGGVADRDKAQAAISSAASPEQLAGVIGTYKQLLAGQLNGLRLQYKNTTGRDDFESKLLPETRAQLESLGVGASQSGSGNPGSAWSRMTDPQRKTAMQFKGSTAPVGQSGNPYVPVTQAQFDKLPVGAWFINPADGRPLRKTH